MENHLLYLAYGPKDIARECLFSIYSLINLYNGNIPDFEITVYSDTPDYLQEHLPQDIKLRELSKKEIG